MNQAIVDVLYHQCIFHSDNYNLNETKMYFDLLQEEFEKDKDAFVSFFDSFKLEELKKIKNFVKTGKIFKESEVPEVQTDIKAGKSDLDLEIQVVKKICQNPKVLEKALGNGIRVQNIEHPISDSNERCDIVLINEDGVLFPTEVKLGKATHAIVGQIDKYCKYFRSKLIYHLFDRVQGVTIANSYSEYAITELQKNNIICLKYSTNGIEGISIDIIC